MATASGVSQENLRAAQKVLDHQWTMRCTEDAISSTEHPSLCPVRELFTRFGDERALQYIKQIVEKQRIEKVIEYAYMELTSPCVDFEISSFLAKAQFGIGTCSTFAFSAAHSLRCYGLETDIAVILAVNPNAVNPNSGLVMHSHEMHTFTMFGEGIEKTIAERMHTHTVSQIFRKCKHAWICDRVLSRQIKTVEQYARGPEFEYFVRLNISKIHCLKVVNRERAYCDGVGRDAKRLHALAKTLVTEIEGDAVKAIQENEPRICAAKLQVFIPGSLWHYPKQLWCEEPTERAVCAASYLKAHGIAIEFRKVKEKDARVIIIKGPDFDTISKLPSCEEYLVIRATQPFFTMMEPSQSARHDAAGLSKLIASYC